MTQVVSTPHSGDVKISNICQDDWDAVRGEIASMMVEGKTVTPHYPPPYAGMTSREIEIWLNSDQPAVRFIATAGDTVVGYAQIGEAHHYVHSHLEGTDFFPLSFPKHLMELGRVYVSPQSRHHRVGARLVRSAMEWADLNHFPLVLVVVDGPDSALPLYAKLGWTEIAGFFGRDGYNRIMKPPAAETQSLYLAETRPPGQKGYPRK